MSLCQQLKNDQSNILCNFGDVTMSGFKVIWEGAGGGGGGGVGGKEEDRNSPLPVAGITKMPGLNRVSAIRFHFILLFNYY